SAAAARGECRRASAAHRKAQEGWEKSGGAAGCLARRRSELCCVKPAIAFCEKCAIAMAGLVPAIHFGKMPLISAKRSLESDKFTAFVALHIKKCGEVTMVDARRRGRGDFRFAVIGDADAGFQEHIEVIGEIGRAHV